MIMSVNKVAQVTGANRGMGLETSDDVQHSGGYYRNREMIDW
jgi:NAD(P)-dependent dehydrogenase (short-subunit alcohol dehydrogenase family)